MNLVKRTLASKCTSYLPTHLRPNIIQVLYLMRWSWHFVQTLSHLHSTEEKLPKCQFLILNILNSSERLTNVCPISTHIHCCCCCWVTSLMSNSVQPHRWHPTRLHCPWDSPGKNTGVGCHFLLQCMKVKSESEVAQSCLTLSDPMNCSPPGSSILGIFQARELEWVAIAFSRPNTLRKP